MENGHFNLLWSSIPNMELIMFQSLTFKITYVNKSINNNCSFCYRPKVDSVLRCVLFFLYCINVQTIKISN